MKRPSGDVLIWSSILIAGAVYTLWRLPHAAPEMRYISAGVGIWMFLVGVLFWFRYRWAPELFIVLLLFGFGWAAVKSLADRPTASRLGMMAGAVCTAFAYPSLRRGVRNPLPGSMSDIPSFARSAWLKAASAKEAGHEPTLSRWAAVALAGRCARLTLPLFDQVEPSVDSARKEYLDSAVSQVEASAASANANVDALNAIWTQIVIERGKLVRTTEELTKSGPLAGSAATAHAVAIKVTFVIEHAINSARGEREHAVLDAYRAYKSAEQACELASDTGLQQRLADDFALIHEKEVDQQWTDVSPVSPSVFERRDVS